MSFTFYLTAECANCDEEIAQGPCMTLNEHGGLPAIPFDMAAQSTFYCPACQTSSYTGDFELLSEDDV